MININIAIHFSKASQMAQCRESACQRKRHGRHWFSPGVGKNLWRRKEQPTPVLLPGESTEGRSLVGYSHPLGASLVTQRLNVCLQCRRPGFNPWVRKIPWRRKWQPTPVFLPR